MLIRINVFGRSMWISAGELPEKERKRFYAECRRYDLPPEVAMFSPGFLEQLHLRRMDGKEIRNWREINETFQCYGHLPDARSSIEIKADGKRLIKFAASSVLEEGLLFPVLETVQEKIGLNSTFILRETVTGLSGVYRFTRKVFDPGLLTFQLSEINFRDRNIRLITAIHYDGRQLARSEDDCVVTGWEMG